jgi:hypothetical protein
MKKHSTRVSKKEKSQNDSKKKEKSQDGLKKKETSAEQDFSLFPETFKKYRIKEIKEAHFFYVPEFVENASEMFSLLRKKIFWEQGYVKLLGKKLAERRLTCMMSTNPGKAYTYSGKTTETLPLIRVCERLRLILNYELDVEFDTCLTLSDGGGKPLRQKES